MSIYGGLLKNEEYLCVVGMGYVGMPIAVAFAKKGINVIGYDTNKEKIELYRKGIDPTAEIGIEVQQESLFYSSDEKDIQKARFIIVAVPTPVNVDHTPDLTPILNATRTIARNMNKSSIIVFESTVYPGCTENVCIPLLEDVSGLKCGENFWVGYSPERINPGDKVHKLENICKVVSGVDDYSIEEIEKIYNIVIEAGTHKVSNIKTAEAIKVVENSQRDINIAFMNELAMVFDRMGIDSNEVVDGMNTKWNSLGFRPGLVGGHCISVDPFYFTYQAERLGYHSQIILNGRIVNDQMGEYVAEKAVKKMIEAGQTPKRSKVVIWGITFKENCPDVRNSKVYDIVKCLKSYGICPIVVDSCANENDVREIYELSVEKMDQVQDADCIIIAVAHDEYKKMDFTQMLKYFKYGNSNKSVLIDVKGICKKNDLMKSELTWWRL